MTTNYYIPLELIQGTQAVLPPEEAKHAGQVLRKRAGDFITAVDGVGGWYHIVLIEVGKKRVVGEIRETKQDVGEPAFELTVAMGILKNQKRFEVFAEKAVELGVTRIIPLKTERTEKPSLRRERLEKILVAAMKQCGRSRLVQLDPVVGLDAVFADDVLAKTEAACKLICHEKVAGGASFMSALTANDTSAVVLVGPEGGFAESEVTEAVAQGFTPVSLGDRRLRAETAAIAACAGVMLQGARSSSIG